MGTAAVSHSPKSSRRNGAAKRDIYALQHLKQSSSLVLGKAPINAKLAK